VTCRKKQEAGVITNWVKCTDGQGRSIYVNLGNAVSMRRIPGTGGQQDTTNIYFPNVHKAEDCISVRETPDDILKGA
jgi:hypothetical protein